MSSDHIDKLFDATLVGEYDDDEPWRAVRELHRNADNTVLQKARSWCTSPDPAKHARAADVLAQLRSPKLSGSGHVADGEPISVAEATDLIFHMIQVEAEEHPLRSELFALGHLYREEVVPTLIRYKAHPSSEIRSAVTWSLGTYPNNPQAIEALISLCDDEDERVRDHAVFALGTQSDVDSPKLREIFVRRLDDSSEVVKEEAIAGLAKRRDQRAVLPLLHLLEAGSYFTHHESNFQLLLGASAPENGWHVDDLIEALYLRFPELLPPRVDSAPESKKLH